MVGLWRKNKEEKWENKNEKERGKEVAWPGGLKRGDNNL